MAGMHAHTQVHAHTHVHVCIHICIRTHTHSRTYTHYLTHTHILFLTCECGVLFRLTTCLRYGACRHNNDPVPEKNVAPING